MLLFACYRVQPDEIKVRAGEWDSQTENERIPYQERNVAQIIIHENYISVKRNLFNDVALLILERSFAKVESVSTVCLPQQNTVLQSRNCFATGWGKTTFGEQGRYAAILKKIKMPTIPHKNCEQALRKTRLKESFVLHSSFMCAGGQAGLDTCTVILNIHKIKLKFIGTYFHFREMVVVLWSARIPTIPLVMFKQEL